MKKPETDPKHCGVIPRPRKTHDVRAVAAAVLRENPVLAREVRGS